MNTTIIEVIIASMVVICLFVIPVIILIFIGTTHHRHFKKMKNQTETQGRVINREYIEAPDSVDGSYSGSDYYQVTYEFEDRYGNHFVKRFDTGRCPFKEGDNIRLYYDAANPNDCVTAHEVELSKNAPRNILFAILIFAMICIVIFLFLKWAVRRQNNI